MTIHQLSVFVENKSGTLLQVLEDCFYYIRYRRVRHLPYYLF